jgi:hypothetical protein
VRINIAGGKNDGRRSNEEVKKDGRRRKKE